MDPNADLRSVEQSLTALTKRISENNSIDLKTRRALQKATQKLSNALEEPEDTLQRIAFLVMLSSSATISYSLSHTHE